MRKNVKRARLWLINKLTRRIRLLKKHIETEKTENKIEKLHSEIKYLKQIDIDEVSKFALCNKWNSKNSSIYTLDMGQKLMMGLAKHILVQSLTQSFHQTHKIPLDRLVILVRSLGGKYKTRRKQKLSENIRGSDEKEQDQVFMKSKDSGKNETHTEESLSVTTTEKEIKEMASRTHTVELCSPQLTKNQSFVNERDTDGVEVTPSRQNNKLKRKRTVDQKIFWPNISLPSIDKKVGNIEIRQLNLDMCENDIVTASEVKSVFTKVKVPKEPPRDSFFLGGIDPPVNSDDEKSKKDYVKTEL